MLIETFLFIFTSTTRSSALQEQFFFVIKILLLEKNNLVYKEYIGLIRYFFCHSTFLKSFRGYTVYMLHTFCLIIITSQEVTF